MSRVCDTRSSSMEMSSSSDDDDDDESFSFIPAIFKALTTPIANEHSPVPSGGLHPDELPYPKSTEWPHDDHIFNFILDHFFTVPGKPSLGTAFFTVHRGEEEITLPIRYRIPVLWTAKYLSTSLKLVLTNNEWNSYRLSILHVSKALSALLDAAKEGGVKERRWCFEGFDRMAVRYRYGCLLNDPETVSKFCETNGENVFEKGIVGFDWKRWAMKGVHKFDLTEAEIEMGISEERMRGGLVQRDGVWIWDTTLEPEAPVLLALPPDEEQKPRPGSHPAPPQPPSIHIPIPHSWQNGIKVSDSYRTGKRKREASPSLPPPPLLLPVSSASNDLNPASVNALRAQLLPTSRPPPLGTGMQPQPLPQPQPSPESQTLTTLLTQITSLQTLHSTTSAENRSLRDECRVVRSEVGRLRKYLAVKKSSSSSQRLPKPGRPTKSYNPLGHLLGPPATHHGGGGEEDVEFDMDLAYPDSPIIKTEDVEVSSIPPATTTDTPFVLDEDILEIWMLPSAASAQPSVAEGTGTGAGEGGATEASGTTQQVNGRTDPRGRRKMFVAKAGGLRVL